MEVELWKRPPTRRAEDPLPPRPTTHRNTGCVFTRDGRVGMTSLARLDTMRRMHTTQRSDPNREHDFASRDLFRAVTLAHRHAPKSQRASRPAVDGRIMSVLKQHLHVTQRDTQHLTAHGHPLTY
jgi:hypothetical protein